MPSPPRSGQGPTRPAPATTPSPAPIPGQGPRGPSPVLDAPGLPPLPDSPPYLKYAFANPYNLSILLGTLAVAAIASSPLIAVAALAAEAIWLLNAPGSSVLRRWLWDPQFEQEKRRWEAAQRANRVLLLNQRDRQRVERLVMLKRDIQRLASQNPTFSRELLRGELAKTERLTDAFLDMAVTCARYEQYLSTVDLPALDAERARWDAAVRQGGADGAPVDLAKRNLAIIMKRFEKVQEIRQYLDRARGELDLLENSFRLLADQIVTMQSPQELAGQLDGLLTGVEAIKESIDDTERMLAGASLTTTA